MLDGPTSVAFGFVAVGFLWLFIATFFLGFVRAVRKFLG